MHLTLKAVIALFGGSSVVAAAIAIFFSNLLNQRLLSQWRRNEQTQVEGLKHAFENERVLLESSIRGAQQGLDKGHERRLNAMEKVWTATLRLREKGAPMQFFFSILLPSEYDNVFTSSNKRISAILDDVDDAYVAGMMQDVVDVETVRPYLGELLWNRFFIYRAFIGRIGHLVSQGRQKQHIADWREDNGIKQILTAVMTASEMDKLLGGGQNVWAIQTTIQQLERLILQEISTVISGQRSAAESFENSKELSKYVASLVTSRS